ncbi:hypothetical protein KB976_000357 [Vibrio parahaemolyticus]|nr:hypothetical protein [Vibrio parahaemolyticus]
MFVEGIKIGDVQLKSRRTFKPNERRFNVISSGGGTQSNAMIVLCYLGYLPKPDMIVMSDTEREMANVFDYQKKYIQPLCDEMGVEYNIVKKSDYTKEDITLNSDDEVVLPPFYTEYNGRNEKNLCSKQPSWCSGKWKTDVIRRFLNDRTNKKFLDKIGVDFWMGITADERRRIKYPTGKWQRRYPLFESLLTRNDCIKIVEAFGLPTPPRSACWMCPNRSDFEWAEMKREMPSEFAKAAEFEKELQKDFPWLWLHQQGIPITMVEFDESKNNKMDGSCDSGLCFI